MREELMIRESVNELIKRKVAESNVPKGVKSLLNEFLILELEHIDEKSSWWGCRGEYEKLVKKYSIR